MPIRLRVEANDRDLERLLTFLDGFTHLNAFSKQTLLNEAREWVRLSDPLSYPTNQCGIGACSVTLAVESEGAASSQNRSVGPPGVQDSLGE
jgi:hypothetical protein